MTGTELKQRLSAILAADAAGYTRLMSLDERATVAALDAARAVSRGQIEASQGRVIDMADGTVYGDGVNIAVLPLNNMSGDPEQEYFTDGVTEDIITELSRCHSLFVIARNSSFTYKGKAVDVRQGDRRCACGVGQRRDHKRIRVAKGKIKRLDPARNRFGRLLGHRPTR